MSALRYHLLDTSALAKRYHVELGRERMQAIFALPERSIFISDLTIIEMHSVFAKKVRIGEIAPLEFTRILERFNNDIAEGLFTVVYESPQERSH